MYMFMYVNVSLELSPMCSSYVESKYSKQKEESKKKELENRWVPILLHKLD